MKKYLISMIIIVMFVFLANVEADAISSICNSGVFEYGIGDIDAPFIGKSLWISINDIPNEIYNNPEFKNVLNQEFKVTFKNVPVITGEELSDWNKVVNNNEFIFTKTGFLSGQNNLEEIYTDTTSVSTLVYYFKTSDSNYKFSCDDVVIQNADEISGQIMLSTFISMGKCSCDISGMRLILAIDDSQTPPQGMVVVFATGTKEEAFNKFNTLLNDIDLNYAGQMQNFISPYFALDSNNKKLTKTSSLDIAEMMAVSNGIYAYPIAEFQGNITSCSMGSSSNNTPIVTPISNPEPRCRIENGKYYDTEGNEITKEKYENICAENPPTGQFMPYTIIIMGVILAAVLYLVSKKKIYNI